jgi:hypothetical protein
VQWNANVKAGERERVEGWMVDTHTHTHAHTPIWRDGGGLTSPTDTGGIFTGTRVDNGVDHDLDRVLVGQQVDDLESVLDDP